MSDSLWLPLAAACQASLSFTLCLSLLKLVCIESVMPSNRLIVCCPLLVLPSIFSSIRVFQWVSSSSHLFIAFLLSNWQCRIIFSLNFLKREHNLIEISFIYSIKSYIQVTDLVIQINIVKERGQKYAFGWASLFSSHQVVFFRRKGLVISWITKI